MQGNAYAAASPPTACRRSQWERMGNFLSGTSLADTQIGSTASKYTLFSSSSPPLISSPSPLLSSPLLSSPPLLSAPLRSSRLPSPPLPSHPLPSSPLLSSPLLSSPLLSPPLLSSPLFFSPPLQLPLACFPPSASPLPFLSAHPPRLSSLSLSHPDAACQFSPSGSKIVSCSDDRTIRVFDASSGTQLKSIESHVGEVLDLLLLPPAPAPAPARPVVATGSADCSCILSDYERGLMLSKFGGRDGKEGHEKKVLCIAFSEDGQFFASGSSDTTILSWNLRTEERVLLRGHTGEVNQVLYTRELTLLSVSSDASFRLW
eukprot:478223-Hanusia_phi.AAC.1